VIVAFVMFLLIKGMNKMKKEAPAAAPAHPTVRVCWRRSVTC
jgi:large conductance mechanosensitive channel